MLAHKDVKSAIYMLHSCLQVISSLVIFCISFCKYFSENIGCIFQKNKVGNVNLHLQPIPLHSEAEHGTRQGVDDRDSKRNLDGIPNGRSHTYISFLNCSHLLIKFCNYNTCFLVIDLWKFLSSSVCVTSIYKKVSLSDIAFELIFQLIHN